MKSVAKWLFKKTHAQDLQRLRDECQVKSLGISKRKGVYGAMQYLGLW